MDLSLVLPAYNAEAFIEHSVSRVSTFLNGSDLEFEIIVVDDGSSDRTSRLVTALNLPQVRLITLPKNLGKCDAVTEGMKAATGSARIFTDADIPFDLEALTYIHSHIAERQFHLVIGDRALPQSTYNEHNSFIRRSATFIFSGLVRMFVTGGLFDTQCGLKGFRGDVAEQIFPLLTSKGFSGDVELLYIALKYNLEIKRIPVRLRNAAPSTVHVLRHGCSMVGSIALLKLNWHSGKYVSDGLREIASQRYWDDD